MPNTVCNEVDPSQILTPEALVNMPAQPARRRWSQDEDDALREAVTKHGTGSWDKVACDVGSRRDWQCRERWHNHLQPDVRKDEWAQWEDDLIFTYVSQNGHKWKDIAALLPGRTGSAVKNRYHVRRKHLQAASRTQLQPAPGQPVVIAAAQLAEGIPCDVFGISQMQNLALMGAVPQQELPPFQPAMPLAEAQLVDAAKRSHDDCSSGALLAQRPASVSNNEVITAPQYVNALQTLHHAIEYTSMLPPSDYKEQLLNSLMSELRQACMMSMDNADFGICEGVARAQAGF